MSATLGGRPLTELRVNRAGVTAVTPALPAGPVDLVVATEGGSVMHEGAYTSATSIEVSPKRVAPEGGTLVKVKGLGFSTSRTSRTSVCGSFPASTAAS